MDPMNEYLELDDHPIIIIEYTEILERIRNNKILCLLSNKGKVLKGIKGTIIIEIIRDNDGVRKINVVFDLLKEILMWELSYLLEVLWK